MLKVLTHRSSLVDFWGVVRLGPDQQEGVILTGWTFESDPIPDDTIPVQVALLGQQSDGSLKMVTDRYLPSSVTNGAGSVIVADFNGDGRDDIFLAAHNETPMLPKASTVYFSNADSTFSAVNLEDSVMAHQASLFSFNDEPMVIATSFVEDSHHLIYTYDGQNGFDIHVLDQTVNGMSAAAADFWGDGGLQIIFGDVTYGPGIQYSDDNAMQQYIYDYSDGELVGNPVSLPEPYFNNKPGYEIYESNWDPSSKTHNSRLWTDDLNHDGNMDIVVGAEIWCEDGIQKYALQMLINQENKEFIDETDKLNPEWDEDSYYDYSLRMADIDQSGINTYFIAGNPYSKYINDEWVSQNIRHGNYILVNDGTGKFHVAMHNEFLRLGNYVYRYVQQVYAKSSFYLPSTPPPYDTPRFIAYQTPEGLINFVAMESMSDFDELNKIWVFRRILINVPLNINLKTDFTKRIRIKDRNGSHLIRTFAGDDIIHGGNSNGYCKIDGGLGENTIVYSSSRNNYTIENASDGYVVMDNVGSDGVDTIKNIQKLQFSDAIIELSGDGLLEFSKNKAGH